MVASANYNPLRGPRLALAALALLVPSVFARGAEPDRDRAARAALALAGAPAAPKAALAVAPMPRPKLALSYADGYAKAAADDKPLVVFVGCPGEHTAAGAVVSRAERFADVVPPAVVIGYPVGDRLYVHVTLQCPVAAEQLAAAVKAAAKKISDPPAKAMPAPAPIDWTLRADPPAKSPDAGAGKGGACPDCAKCPHCDGRQLRDALVRVRSGDGSGSGTVVWSGDGKSVVLTAAHVLSRGAEHTVRAAGKWHAAQVLASDPAADLAALLVAAPLPAAPVADADPADGAEVTMYGVTSLWSRGAITGGMTLEGRAVYTLGYDSDGGDSGGGVFANGHLVGVHCGKVGDTRAAVGKPYCTAAGPVRAFLARVLKRDGAKTVLVDQPKAAPAPKAVPVPKAALADTLVIGGVTYTRGADGVYRSAGAGPSCPNGKCPLEKPAPRLAPQYR